jgi:uncharacterized membrane protein
LQSFFGEKFRSVILLAIRILPIGLFTKTCKNTNVVKLMHTEVQRPIARLASIDVLRGAIMILMALDHVRAFFHWHSFCHNPTNPLHTTLPIFFTRWITHFCEPGFCLLAGLSAYLWGSSRSKANLSRFLITRGIWLIVVEITLVNFAWHFDIQFRSMHLSVLWMLGVCMILMAGIIHLGRAEILLFSILLICGHNLLDPVATKSVLWSLLHRPSLHQLFNGRLTLLVADPIIPWLGVMVLGYYFGSYFDASVTNVRRTKLFNSVGFLFLFLFAVLRISGLYGDSKVFTPQTSFSRTLISFLNCTKYPPSLQFLLLTLGVLLLALTVAGRLQSRLGSYFATFGRVPFFFYVVHLFLIHGLAMAIAGANGFGGHRLVIRVWMSIDPQMKGFGFSLFVVYIIWALIVLVLFPACKWFATYKALHRDRKWLSFF